jgi:hypothetical protein
MFHAMHKKQFPISKFLARGLMCAGIFAGSASVVCGQITSSTSTSCYAAAGNGEPDYEATSASSEGEEGMDGGYGMRADGTTGEITILVPVFATAFANATVTGHSITFGTSADVDDDYNASFANADASARLSSTASIHSSSDAPESGYWQITFDYEESGDNYSAYITGAIDTYDAQGNQFDHQNFSDSPGGVPLANHQDIVTIPTPTNGLYDGSYVVITLNGEASASADSTDPSAFIDLSHTVWLQFVADDPSTLSAVGEDGWDFSTPYTNVPATVIAPTLISFGFTGYNADAPFGSAYNQFQLGVTGTFNTNYIVQATCNLASTNWIPLITNSAPFIFTDTNANLYTQRFYRALVVP